MKNWLTLVNYQHRHVVDPPKINFLEDYISANEIVTCSREWLKLANLYTVFHKKRPLFVFLIIHSNDHQSTHNFYQL